jgi:hypothetical protein
MWEEQDVGAEWRGEQNCLMKLLEENSIRKEHCKKVV